ncbi:FAD-binding oxidoreductase [Streptomyces sp. NPDC096012]|uniref:FAD-binding oxidoreductase n=1 Tax=Streptomyces sp. NPDC096012 TaxID=3155684 RepID=UPI003369E3C8
MSGDTVAVTGPGRTAPAVARLIRPRSYEEAAAAVRDCGARGAVPRGLGRAHGDAARNAGGAVLDMTGLDRIHVVDASEGIVLCDAGVLLHRLADVLLPLGWFLPVAPGTRRVTVGGAIGADLHGGDHHVSGSFSHHVLSLELLTADGEVRTVSPGTPLFEATAGGMGLTGIILTATFRLLPVETAYLTVDTERAADLDGLLARLGAGDHRHRYSVARIDLLARGAATGRGVVTRAEHAPPDALGRGTRAWRHSLSVRPRRLPSALGPVPSAPASVPSAAAFLPGGPLGPAALLPGGLLGPAGLLPSGLLGPSAVALVNELWFRTAPRARTGQIQRLSAFFPPLDGLPHRNRPHGGGFVQYQFVIGHGREDALHRIVRRIAERRLPSFPAVLKRLGDAGPGWLSFPVPGWTLALDIPAALPGLASFLDELDEEVAAAGGRVCLAEDARLRPDLLAAMYPRVADFRDLRARLDPRGVFVSDLARRLRL